MGFSRFLNCENGTKSCKVFHIIIAIAVYPEDATLHSESDQASDL